jgi:hypothetical protein
MVQGLFGLVQAAFGVIAGLVAVVAVAPALLPLLVLVVVPAWLAASKRGAAFHNFFWKMTRRDRQRHYLSSLLQTRQSAKEVRAFGLAGHLRRRYEDLYDERMAELRRLAGQQVRWSLAANAAKRRVVGRRTHRIRQLPRRLPGVRRAVAAGAARPADRAGAGRVHHAGRRARLLPVPDRHRTGPARGVAGDHRR